MRQILIVILMTVPVAADEPVPDVVEFNRDVRPILSDACWRCHGPDQHSRKADLRLDTELGAIGDGSHPGAVVRGKSNESELFDRITSTNADEKMPPPYSGKTLAPRQIAILKRWIDQGAKWDKHWSFIPPRQAAIPAVQNPTWSRTGIDRFVLARLDRENLSPSLPATRPTLIRRVTLDVTGLPPTPEEVDAFVADERPDAYERLIDRLLASPRYGERMAIRWLEAARYADTSGYQSDGPRDMWRWRDWVIDAFNHDQPFDQFTIEQIAGDLLPNASLDQQIATGFNRNHRGNSEGGIVPEEYAVEYVVDRVDTTCTTWLGLTMSCMRCHDHKFDPFTQREYYQLFAYFNNVPEFGRAIKEGNSPPYVKAPTFLEREKLAAMQASLDDAERRVRELEPVLEKLLNDWVTKQSKQNDGGNDPSIDYELDGQIAKFSLQGKPHLDAGDVGAFGYMDKFSLAVRVRPDGSQGGTLISRMADMPEADGYYVRAVDGRVQVNLIKRWLDDAIRVETERRLTPDDWQHVLVTYDGSRLAAGIHVYFNGEPQKLIVHLDLLNQTFLTKEPLRIGFGGGEEGQFRGQLEDARVFNRALTADEVSVVAVAESVAAIVKLPAGKRSAAMNQKLRSYYLENVAPTPLRRAFEILAKRRRDVTAFADSISTVMVMQESATPRATRFLRRGEYDKPGDVVTASVPASLHPLPTNEPNSRLALARWLVDPQNPLTSRVMVNRIWQTYFGVGLVKTTEDFGSQGEVPVHSELLDWLAVELPKTGWGLKSIQRQIVTSSTYRQASSPADPKSAVVTIDPENRLLARGPRYRLPAEVIRDQALFASGLLVERLGGRSVKPYQPADFWKDLATDNQYVQSQGADLYRRSLYTFWKRTVAPPTLTTFDAMTRDFCVVKANRTNTPLQALTLLNETTFVEAARVLAERMITVGGSSTEERIRFAFQALLVREPTKNELTILAASVGKHRAWYAEHKAAAEELVRTGELPRNDAIDVIEHAAFTAVASVLLNLDEVVTKE